MGPFRLGSALNILKSEAGLPNQSVAPAESRFSFEVSGGAVSVDVSQPSPDSDVIVKFEDAGIAEMDADIVVNQLMRMLSLDVDATPFFEALTNDDYLRSTLAICPGLRPVLYPTPYEGAITSMIGVHSDVQDAALQLANLREVCGVVPGKTPYATPAFPGKFTLLATPDKLLELAGLSEELIRRIKSLTESLVGDPDPLEEVQFIGDPEFAIERLTELPGITHSVAFHMLQYAYGYPDLLVDSPMLKKAIKRFYGVTVEPDIGMIHELSEPYSGWRSWWSFLLVAADQSSMLV